MCLRLIVPEQQREGRLSLALIESLRYHVCIGCKQEAGAEQAKDKSYRRRWNLRLKDVWVEAHRRKARPTARDGSRS